LGVIVVGLAFLPAFAIDQGAKALVLARPWHGRLGGLIRVRLVVPGESAHPRRHQSALVIVWALAAAASVMVSLELSPVLRGGLASVGVGLALGGAGSNLADRVFRGGIVDFVDLRIWPVFNPADVAIVGGLVLAVLSL
jgi:hypothetical protein